MKAPNFTLPDQNGKRYSLTDFSGSWLVLYFYPKDDTPGCTKEACNFRDQYEVFDQKGVKIIGVSKDSVESHKKFADKFNLHFPLLSDESKEMIQAYKAWGKKKFMGKEFDGILRKTYLIGPHGEIKKVYENVNPTQHADELLQDLNTFI